MHAVCFQFSSMNVTLVMALFNPSNCVQIRRARHHANFASRVRVVSTEQQAPQSHDGMPPSRPHRISLGHAPQVVVWDADAALLEPRDPRSRGAEALTLGRHSGRSLGWAPADGAAAARPGAAACCAFLDAAGYRLLFLSECPITAAPAVRRRLVEAARAAAAEAAAAASAAGARGPAVGEGAVPRGALLTTADHTMHGPLPEHPRALPRGRRSLIHFPRQKQRDRDRDRQTDGQSEEDRERERLQDQEE